MDRFHTRKVRCVTFVIAFLCIWLFVGVVNIERMEGENYHALFVKKSPTFRVIFFDSYTSDAMEEEHLYRKRMDVNGDWEIGTYERNEFLRYCKYRYGIANNDQIKA